MRAIGIGIPFIRRRGGGFDADYQAVLNYAVTLSYTLPSAGQQVLQNQLMLDLKSAGVWNKLDSFRVYATDGSSDFALIDWKRLITCTAVNSPTFTTNAGYKGNGTSSYIDSNFTPSTNGVNYTLNSASIFAYISGVRTIGQIQAYQGYFFGSGYLLLAAGTNLLGESYINSITAVTNGTTGVGFQLVNRLNSTSLNVYYQGVLQNTNNASPSIQLPFISVWDLAANNNSSGSFFSDVQDAIVGYGANLNAEQSAFNTAVNNYMNAI
jgi:hypothetical protein